MKAEKFILHLLDLIILVWYLLYWLRLPIIMLILWTHLILTNVLTVLLFSTQIVIRFGIDIQSCSVLHMMLYVRLYTSWTTNDNLLKLLFVVLILGWHIIIEVVMKSWLNFWGLFGFFKEFFIVKVRVLVLLLNNIVAVHQRPVSIIVLFLLSLVKILHRLVSDLV